MITKEDINWTLESHRNLSKAYQSKFVDKKLGISKEVITSKTHGGYGVGSSKEYYFIDKDKREFRTIEAIIGALNLQPKLKLVK